MDRALLERMVGAVALVLLLVVVAPLLLDGTNGSGPAKIEGEPEEDVRTAVIVLNEPRSPQDAPETPVGGGNARPEVIAPPRVVEAPKQKAPKQESPMQIAASAPAETVPVETPAPVTKPAGKAQPAALPVNQTAATATTAVAADSTKVPEAPAEIVEPPTAASSVATTRAADESAAGGFAVQLGSFGQRSNADKLVADLKKRGFAVFVRSTPGATGSVHRVYAGPRPDRAAAEKLAMVLGDAGYKGIVVNLADKTGGGGR